MLHAGCWPVLAARSRIRVHAVLLVLLAVSLQQTRGQTIVWTSGSPKLIVVHDYKIEKSVGSGSSGAGGSFSAVRGGSIDLAYTIKVERTVASSSGTLSFTVTCSSTAKSVDVLNVDTGASIATASVSGTTATFTDVKFAAPNAPSNTPAGQIVAVCNALGPIKGDPTDVIYTSANTVFVREEATLTDVITWPTWSTYFPVGGWLTTAPTTSVTSGTHPSSGTMVTGPFPRTFTYTWTVSKLALCLNGVQVPNTATLTSGSGSEARTYTAQATATLTVTNCDVQPTFMISTPNLQTSLTYAWSQTPSFTPSALTVPWGGGGTFQAQTTFTRTVTSESFMVSFQLQIANPSTETIAVTNLQLSCPWGGNTLLPCGTYTGAASGPLGAGTWLAIPGSSTISCLVNNLQLQARWGTDFTQPCTIMTSNWMGTQTTYTGLVLNFAAPTRWITNYNCAMWSVTCSTSSGNPNWVPAVGGLPSGQQVCGNDNNAPLPPQTFSVSLSGGWIGDGTQPTACAGSVTINCRSELVPQSTSGTTQAYGGTQSSTLSAQATPIDCPRPVSSPTPLYLPSPSPSNSWNSFASWNLRLSVTPRVTRTFIRGSFNWAVTSSITPASQSMPQGSSGQPGRYTVTATPQATSRGDQTQFIIEGFVSVQNAEQAVSIRVDEVYAVVDTAAVPLSCIPYLPAILAPGAKIDCPFMVNYNQGFTPNTINGRATVVSEVGTRNPVDGTGVRFGFSNADVSQAQGACARIYQTFATNWFDLAQTSGVAPSFDSDNPTDVCGPTTWTFDVLFTPRTGTPCGTQQVIQTVTALYSSGSGDLSSQGSSTANFDMFGPRCPNTGSSAGSSGSWPTSNDQTVIEETGSRAANTPGGYTDGSTSTGPAEDGTAVQQVGTNTGLLVVLSDVQAQKSPVPAWDLSMEAVEANVTFKPGQAAAVPFKLTWAQTKPAVDYSGAVTITNNRAEAVSIDGVALELMESMGSGNTVGTGTADCPQDILGVLQPVSSSRTLQLKPGASATCNFTMRATSGGSLMATVTTADGGDASISKPAAVTMLMADSSCGKLIAGVAASELGDQGVLKSLNGTLQEEACGRGERVVNIQVPASASPGKGCRFPVVAVAWLRPSDTSSIQQSVTASAQSDVILTGCKAPQDASTAVLSPLLVRRVRYMRWSVEIGTDPPVEGTYDGNSLNVTTTWQQKLDPEQKLNVSGEVVINGSAATVAQVVAIPVCGPTANNLTANNSAGCSPVVYEAGCMPGTQGVMRCAFNFSSLPDAPGLLQASVGGALAIAALPYDPTKAAWGGRPPNQCVELSEDRSLIPLDGGSPPKISVAGATPLPGPKFCALRYSSNYTVTFDGLECEKLYAFKVKAAATPLVPGLPAVTSELNANITC